MIIACAIIGLLVLVRISVNLISARALSKSKQRINNGKQTNENVDDKRFLYVSVLVLFSWKEDSTSIMTRKA